jgi:hypothetical protein
MSLSEAERIWVKWYPLAMSEEELEEQQNKQAKQALKNIRRK